MKASLQLKISQNLTMTPQLQQAIKLLQLSRLELQLEIQNMIETNPLLEEEDEFDTETWEHAETGKEDDEGYQETQEQELGDKLFEQQASENMSEFTPQDLNEEIDADPAQRIEVEDFYQVDSIGSYDPDNIYDLENREQSETSLADHLLEQLSLCKMSDRDLEIAYLIIESLNSKGYLEVPIEDLLSTLSKQFSTVIEDDPVEEDEIIAVLHRIQQFEPAGVASRNLQECLQIQLNQLPETTPCLNEAKDLVNRYLNLLGTKDFTQIRRKTKLHEDVLRETIRLIQSLNPEPASQIQSEKTDYVIPDIIIKKQNNQWVAELNEDCLPKIRINSLYASMIGKQSSTEDRQFLKNNLQEAKWFLKSLHSRHDTLLRVAREILRVQESFFDEGEEAMKPLVLHDIAELVEMHESTISRVTTNKYMLTPKGIFELKYFFSSHVRTESGGECSSTAIRALIRKLVSEEDSKKPLSDSKISTILEEKGIKVARRTIAKYRESLSIPPSNERKKLI